MATAPTIIKILDLARQFAGDVDLLAMRYPNLAYLKRLDTELLILQVRTNLGYDGLVLDLTEDAETLLPEPTPMQLLVLATRVAAGILDIEFARRTSAGELGISWKSGLEEESSIQAGKSYQALIAELKRSADDLLAIAAAEALTAGFRAQ